MAMPSPSAIEVEEDLEETERSEGISPRLVKQAFEEIERERLFGFAGERRPRGVRVGRFQ